MTDNMQTGNVDVDGSEMKVFERPVELPAKVVIVDSKNGKEIGFIERERVMELLEKDGRYEGFEDGCTGTFMLSYNSDGDKVKAIRLETEDVFKFLDTIWRNLETAMGADDPKTRMLGVSYEVRGKAYVMSVSINQFIGAARFLHTDVVGAMTSTQEGTTVTDRFIEAFKNWPKDVKV